MARTVKTINLNNGWGISCITSEIPWNGAKTYSIEVYMETVPWNEIVESRKNLLTKEEANEAYLSLKNKYLGLPVY